MAYQLKAKVCLICIDGWGISDKDGVAGDAIYAAETPWMDKFQKEFPYTTLEAHGLAVGLPDGLMGNSEVGHLNIGAGRVVYQKKLNCVRVVEIFVQRIQLKRYFFLQDIVRIDLAVKNKAFNKNDEISRSFDHAKNGSGRIHFLGLVSDGGVHSHINHLEHLLESAKSYGVPKAFVHFFGDGRDTSPRSSDKYLKQLQKHINELNYGEVATIVGRYYAMDRDKRWERIKIAFEALTRGIGTKSEDPIATINQRFGENETDEFLKPIILSNEGRIKGNYVLITAKVPDGDTLFFFNYRADRMREIVQAFGISPPPFEADVPKNLDITTMTKYKSDFPFPVAFSPQKLDNVLAEWLAKHEIPQCHVAETEKYAHVTFFFNGGVEKQFPLEHRDMVPSPKVATYDLKPEMSGSGVADKMVEEISSGKFPFVMCNLANPDMVGHTGVYEATVIAVRVTDECIGRIFEACQEHGYTLFITSDHGNAEQMLDSEGKPHTAHTCNPVPFIMTSKDYKFVSSKGVLGDVAPTILDLLGLEIPKEMTGSTLLSK
ncbi:hypothetical protein G9A89_017112 [Geosiphon pyriformis]|nr:hypothetical protein G9A89_017112 [Geosiphon pyriformis]